MLAILIRFLWPSLWRSTGLEDRRSTGSEDETTPPSSSLSLDSLSASVAMVRKTTRHALAKGKENAGDRRQAYIIGENNVKELNPV